MPGTLGGVTSKTTIEPRPATAVVDPAFVVGPVRPALFGSFVEHMGRCVYGGIYEPTHPTADGEGFRRDVAELVGELGVTAIRYPGDNFVSGYDWEDGIGPRAQRPTRLDRAWRAIESNAVGTDDFLQLAERIGVEPVMAVNLGTRGVQEACDLLEYVNRPGGTKWSDRRVANGRRDPYGVRRCSHRCHGRCCAPSSAGEHPSADGHMRRRRPSGRETVCEHVTSDTRTAYPT